MSKFVGAVVSAMLLFVSPSFADDTCSDGSGECDAASDIVDMTRDNPVVDATGEPDRAQEEIESQPDYTGSDSGSGSDDSSGSDSSDSDE